MPSVPRRVTGPVVRWTNTASNDRPPATSKPGIGPAKPRRETRAIGCKPVQTGPRQPTGPGQQIDRKPLTEARARPGILGRIRRPGKRRRRSINAHRAMHRHVRPRKTGRPRSPPARAVPATMPSPARARRPRPTCKPVVAGPVRHPFSVPALRVQPVNRSVGRPLHPRVKVGAAVE